ncbi:VOC family protein [Leptospira idonii]|uniref:VOC family protein n=1 Tax=Leptospira idonii TaxID=1193500 RepID=A0A4R9M453_9LEPT|nr:VOC family protein [Leptospira idonii]TGN19558.1 VOC family protein [Leptospira idonii]
MIHHIAIGTDSVRFVSQFYLQIPGCRLERENKEETGESLRSVWIRSEDILLMIESGEKEAPKALVFTFQEKDRPDWEVFFQTVRIERRTDYTLYFRDPDGNLLGLSHFPDRIFWKEV